MVGSQRQLRTRVTRVVAKTGADEILRNEPWRVTASGAGADENKPDAVYCAAAVGNRVVAEYKGLSFPVDVRTPLCVLAEAVVTLDVSTAAQPCAVRWLGAGINLIVKANFASAATSTSTPPPADGSGSTVTVTPPPVVSVSCRVPTVDLCGILSVQMVLDGQCMGMEFRHILVLPNDDDDSAAIALEINNKCQEAVSSAAKMKLYRIVSSDLAWLLSAHESGAAYHNATVIARARKIASDLQPIFSSRYECPALERRLKEIELDLLEYQKEEEFKKEEKLDDDGRVLKNPASFSNLQETEYKRKKFGITEAIMPRLRVMGAVLFVLVHLKMLRKHDLPEIVVRDLNVSTTVFIAALGCTQLAEPSDYSRNTCTSCHTQRTRITRDCLLIEYPVHKVFALDLRLD